MIYGDIDERDIEQTSAEHGHRTLGHRLNENTKKELDLANQRIHCLEIERDSLASMLDSALLALGEIRKLKARHHKMDYQEFMTELSAITTSSPAAQPHAKPCQHIYHAVAIDGSNLATRPFKSVCMHCGYEPEPQADGVKV